MSTSARVLRNSLMFLTLAGAVPFVSAADAPAAQHNVPAAGVPVQSATTSIPPLLDLKAPDIHTVMTPGEIAAAIPNDVEMEVLEPDTVQVHGAAPAPYVPGGFAALYWAAFHPFDSWRILAPVQ